MKCCFCKKNIIKEKNGWDKGNNAMPVMDGRCCNECNYGIVIPIRILRTQKSSLKNLGKWINKK